MLALIKQKFIFYFFKVNALRNCVCCLLAKIIRFLSFEFLPSCMSMKLLMLQQKTNFIYLKVLATRGSKTFSYKHHPKTKENKGKKFEPKIKMDQVFSTCSMLVNYKCKWSPREK